MADRAYHKSHTQGVNHVTYACTIKIVSGAPQFVEGDTPSSATGSYMTLTDTGTGEITLNTKDKFLASVSCVATVNKSTPSLDALCNTGLPTKNTDGTWSVLILTGTNSGGTHSAADLASGDTVSVVWRLRNSSVKP